MGGRSGSVDRRLLLLYNINDTVVTVIYLHGFVFMLLELHSRFSTVTFTHVKHMRIDDDGVTTGEVTEV